MLITKPNRKIDILIYSKIQLQYGLQDLSPVISADTMNQHYNVHYENYIKKLNEEYLRHKIKNRIVTVLKNPHKYPAELVDNGGGFVNHSIYFQCLKPLEKVKNEIPTTLQKMMIRDFGSEKEFFNYFIGMGKRVFGSGWVWWCLQNDGLSVIATTKNQDTPYANNLYPLLGIDVWEHAYYLDYKADRLKHLNEILRIVNWQYVEKRLINQISKYV